MKRTFNLAHDTARLMAVREVQNAPMGYVVTVSEPTRSGDQNAAQWPYLQAFADQLEWPVNGKMCKLTPDEWKDILTAAFQQETARLAMGLDGGLVMLGQRTSKFSKKRFSEWMEFLIATAADRGVKVYEDLPENNG
jgi:hypothetical protein